MGEDQQGPRADPADPTRFSRCAIPWRLFGADVWPGRPCAAGGFPGLSREV